MSTFLFIGGMAFLLTVGGCLLAQKLFPWLGLMDKPEKYGLKRAPIPYFGGIVIVIVFLVVTVLFVEIDSKMVGFLGAAFLLTVINFFDDKYSLPPLFRIFMQILCISILIVSGIGITHMTNPFGGTLDLEWYTLSFSWGDMLYQVPLFSALFTLVWLLLMMNAMNWLDGVNGLVSGVSSLGGFIIFALSITPLVNQPEIATLGLILGSIALAFWFFDFYPAKILMGDMGSMFFGLSLGVLAILSGGKVATAFLIMGFPILDALFVIVRRLKKGQSPFKGDYTHFHHRLLESGLTHRQVLCVIYLLCGTFGIAALFLQTWGKFLAIILMFLTMLVMGSLVKEEGKEK